MPPFIAVEGDEDEQEDGECPEGGASVADERQGNADDRHDAESHAYVYEKVHEYAACRAVAVYPCECLPALFCPEDDSPYQEGIQQDDCRGAEEAPFFPDGAEDEVSALLRNEPVCGLCPVQESFSCESSGADCNHGLPYVVAHSGRVVLHSEQDFDALALVVLKYVIEDEVRGEDEKDADDH